MTIEVPEKLEEALKLEANARGTSVEQLALELLERDLQAAESDKGPLISGYGALAGYGPAPSLEDIAEMRREAWPDRGEAA